MRRPHAFSVLVLVLGVVLGAVVVGAVRTTATPGSVSVLASWTGDEEKAFREVLDTFTERTGIRVDYQGTTAQREVLQAGVQAGTPPDIAILPSPGELAEYAARGDLLPLGSVIGSDRRAEYGEPWIPRLELTGENGRDNVYWVPVKADLKSTVWYDAQRYPASRQGPLTRLAEDGDAWCLGMGSDATSGWPGTDWIEDILLQRSGPRVYADWATGEPGSWTSDEVREAWRAWGRILTGKSSEAFGDALTTDFATASRGLFARPSSCALDHQGSFIRGLYERPEDGASAPRADYLPSSHFLTAEGTARTDQTAWEVSADFAGMFRATAQAEKLMRFLASAPAQQEWAASTPDDLPRPLSANRKVPPSTYAADQVTSRIAATLRGTGTRCLDASDAMPPPMRDAFHHAVLTFISSPDTYLSSSGELDTLLKRLEHVRSQVADANGTWLPSVCG